VWDSLPDWGKDIQEDFMQNGLVNLLKNKKKGKSIYDHREEHQKTKRQKGNIFFSSLSLLLFFFLILFTSTIFNHFFFLLYFSVGWYFALRLMNTI